MMAVRIVTGTSEQHTRGPRATRFTHVSVVTTAAKSPQLFTRSSAVDTQLVCCPPDVFETEIANVPARIFRRRERRTTLDRAISLDAECVLSGVTTGPVDSIVAAAAPYRFIRPVITDIVSGLDQKSLVGAFLEQLSDQRHQLEQLVRL